jgi:hypothetical protein
MGIDVPKTPSGAPLSVVRARTEASTPDRAAQYKEMQIREAERKRILAGVFDTTILLTPVTRVIRPVDTIGISTAYITQIVLPQNIVITDIKSSFPTTTFAYHANLIQIRPDSDSFFGGNIVIVGTDGKKPLTIFLERYFQSECRVDDNREYVCRRNLAGELSGSGKDAKGENYKIAMNSLSAYYVYVQPKNINIQKAILLYERLSGKLLKIRRNGDRVTFKYEGVYYNIIRDDKHPQVYYRGGGYRLQPRG